MLNFSNRRTVLIVRPCDRTALVEIDYHLHNNFKAFQICSCRQITRMKTLLIGGTGNISAECAALLDHRGHEVLILTRGGSVVPSKYQAVQADRKDLEEMRAALKEIEPEVVINFIGFELAEVELDYELFRDRVQQYIFISSTTVYERPAKSLPYTEET